MDSDRLFSRYRELQSYVGWTEADARSVVAAAGLVEPFLENLVDDFYAEIERHPAARKVITGGQAQIDRLKGTLGNGSASSSQASTTPNTSAGGGGGLAPRRNRPGAGLYQCPLSRLRSGLIGGLYLSWRNDLQGLTDTVQAFNKLLDLDLAIIEDAYQAEYIARLQRTQPWRRWDRSPVASPTSSAIR